MSSGSISQPGMSARSSRALCALPEASRARLTGAARRPRRAAPASISAIPPAARSSSSVELVARERHALRGRLHLDQPTRRRSSRRSCRPRRRSPRRSRGRGRARRRRSPTETAATESVSARRQADAGRAPGRRRRRRPRSPRSGCRRRPGGRRSRARASARRAPRCPRPRAARGRSAAGSRPCGPSSLPRCRLAWRALAGRGGQERVLGGQPAAAPAGHPARDALLRSSPCRARRVRPCE